MQGQGSLAVLKYTCPVQMGEYMCHHRLVGDVMNTGCLIALQSKAQHPRIVKTGGSKYSPRISSTSGVIPDGIIRTKEKNGYGNTR